MVQNPSELIETLKMVLDGIRGFLRNYLAFCTLAIGFWMHLNYQELPQHAPVLLMLSIIFNFISEAELTMILIATKNKNLFNFKQIQDIKLVDAVGRDLFNILFRLPVLLICLFLCSLFMYLGLFELFLAMGIKYNYIRGDISFRIYSYAIIIVLGILQAYYPQLIGKIWEMILANKKGNDNS